jgi:spermidine/putrescine transport system substrate-binding protein
MNDLSAAPVSRRTILKGAALGGVATFIAACTGTKTGATAAPASASAAPSEAGPATSAEPTPQPSPTGPLMFANWPAYIDLAGSAGDEGAYAPGSSPTLEDFQKQYGVKVDYQEKIGDNATFVETIKPALVAGLATGWDLMVLTDWMASKIVTNGWAEKIDQSSVPNCVANLADGLKGYPWDPNMDYHYPWQSGMTGVGYNAKTLAENNIAEPTKIADLWAIPADKLTFLSEARDTFGLALLKLGIDPNPETVTDDDLQKVADDIQPLVDKGLRFTGNEREDAVHALDDILGAADHQAVPALEAPNAARRTDVEIIDALRLQRFAVADVIDVVRVAAVDQRVA